MWVNIEYPACYPQWVVLGLSDSRPVARLRLAGNQKSKISDNGVNAGILSLKKIDNVTPKPPAPMMPRLTAERTLFSKINIDQAINGRTIWVIIPKVIVWSRLRTV